MRVVVSGRHLHITEAMKNYAREKAEKLSRFYERISSVQVTMDVQGEGHVVEMVLAAHKGSTLVSRVTDKDMYAAIDVAVAKMERQLKRLKEKLQNKRG